MNTSINNTRVGYNPNFGMSLKLAKGTTQEHLKQYVLKNARWNTGEKDLMNGLKQLIEEQKNSKHFDIIFKHVSDGIDEFSITPKTVAGEAYSKRLETKRSGFLDPKKTPYDDGLNKAFKELNELRQKMNSTDSPIKKAYYRILENIKFAASAKNKINYEWKFHSFDVADEASKFTNKKIEADPDTPMEYAIEELDSVLKANKKLMKEIYRKNPDFKYAAGNNKWKLPVELINAGEIAKSNSNMVNIDEKLDRFIQKMNH